MASLATADGALDWFHAIANGLSQFVSPLRAALDGLFDALAGLFREILDSILRVLVPASNILAQLLTALGREHQRNQSACSEADHEKRDCSSGGAFIRGLVISKAHKGNLL